MKADLHMHSVYSDGTYTPEELVLKAKSYGIDMIALTDHDSFDGIKELEEYGKKYGVKTIKGAEITTNLNGEAIHILVYFKNEVPKEILDYNHEFSFRRRKRAIDMANNLNKYFNLDVDVNKLSYMEGNLTRGHLIRLIMERHPEFDRKGAFNKYLSKDSIAYIKSTDLTPTEMIDFYKKYNCLIVLAHPTLYSEEALKTLFNLNFDGIEAIYQRYENHDREYFINVAKEKGWFITAGSDFHGTIDFSHKDLGSVYLEDKDIEIFLERVDNL